MIITEMRGGNSVHTQKHSSQHHLHIIARLDTVSSATCDVLFTALPAPMLSDVRKHPVAPDKSARKGRGSSRVG